MFFRKSGGDAAEVRQDELDALLNSAFDKKLKAIESRADACIGELARGREAYALACEAFENLEAEPDIENPYITNLSSLKEQKRAYSTALNRILRAWSMEVGSGPNMYEGYNATLLKAERFIEETLLVNSKFKQALYSYAEHMSGLKRAFSMIERQRDLLRGMLGRVNRELLEYNAVRERLVSLRMLIDEMKLNSDTVESLAATTRPTGDQLSAEEGTLENEIAASERDLQRLNAEGSRLRAEMGRLMAPLERAARKFDHASGRKERLSDFIAEPEARMADRAGYEEFRRLLSEMEKALESGSVEIENSPKLKEALAMLMGSNLHGTISALRDLDVKRLELEGGIRRSRAALARLRDSRDSEKRTAAALESAMTHSKDAAEMLDSTKRSVERLFLEYYDQKIKIVD